MRNSSQKVSILQHAWAEIEHDLGYKTELEIPKNILRRFNRIAGLLEVADSEFDAIRLSLSKYGKEVGQRIIEEPTEVLIDKLSLTAFIENSNLLNDIAQQVSNRSGLSIVNDYRWGYSYVLKELDYLGIIKISELESQLLTNRNPITNWAVLWLTPDPDEPEDMTKYFDSGAIISYLNYVIIAKSQSLQRVLGFLNLSTRGEPNNIKFAKELISTYLSIVNE